MATETTKIIRNKKQKIRNKKVEEAEAGNKNHLAIFLTLVTQEITTLHRPRKVLCKEKRLEEFEEFEGFEKGLKGWMVKIVNR